MSWNLPEALDYYRRQGAPADQNALIALLSEIQSEHGGSIPRSIPAEIAAAYGIREALVHAVIRRIPRLRLSDTQVLEVCAGPNCGKAAALAARAEALCKESAGNITLKFVPCMRLCGKGPNLRWNGTLYHRADEALLMQLMKNKS